MTDERRSREGNGPHTPRMVAAVLAIHQPAEIHTVEEVDYDTGERTECAIYGDDGELVASTNIEVVCTECAPRMCVPWPCATARAVGAT